MSQLINLVPREKRMMYELKRQATVQEWQQFQGLVGEVLGLREEDAVTDDQVEDLIVKIGQELKAAGKMKVAAKDIDLDKAKQDDKSGVKIADKKESLNEGLALALILAAPTLLTLLAKIVSKIYGKITMSDEEWKAYKEKGAAYAYAKKTKKTIDGKPVTDDDLHHMEEELFNSKAAKAMLKVAHGIHKAYVSPIRLLVAGLQYVGTPDNWKTCWNDSKKPAEVIYCILMFGVAGWGLYHAIPAITGLSAATIAPIVTATVDAVKGGDMTAQLIKTIVSSVSVA
ncbi:hypothetical protein UFOVP450_183 [uncultured Caudovirales phage]|uniref:Uncharacterized protein n=1 Tax=uncultured Caudovirales phage TaxID=2100421 RepID=A0A6J5MBE5_9CAUD|nr:hypothetical protein UFOVP450_183 [uncultured Caudovirales phage]